MPCREHGCPLLCTGSDREFRSYCREHGPAHKRTASIQLKRTRVKTAVSARRIAAQDDDEKALQGFYRTSKWRRKRNAHIAAHPLCVHCEERGTISGADMVDHIVERRDGGSNLDSANLQSLCNKCHAVKTRDERLKRDPKPLEGSDP